ncbi:MAG: helix-turn-helix domain-containing protein [Lachnospiraceae bacterium]|nr:helix-turn-helix domain-containing protein [Lachnospiraceae bacterium]
MTKAEVSELYKVMFTEYPDLLSINELRHMLGVSKHKAYDLINDGSINAIKIGNAFRIPKINVINYILAA